MVDGSSRLNMEPTLQKTFSVIPYCHLRVMLPVLHTYKWQLGGSEWGPLNLHKTLNYWLDGDSRLWSGRIWVESQLSTIARTLINLRLLDHAITSKDLWSGDVKEQVRKVELPWVEARAICFLCQLLCHLAIYSSHQQPFLLALSPFQKTSDIMARSKGLYLDLG